MLRTIFSRVMWLARGTSMLLGLVVMLALVFGMSAMALAAVPGDPFKLGRSNTINKLSSLVGSASTAMLKIDNNGTGPALDLQVEPDTAPLTVNSDMEVDNLRVANATQADDASTLDGKDSQEFAAAHAGIADNADKLDGNDSKDFWTGQTYTRHTDAIEGFADGSVQNQDISCDPGGVLLSGGYNILGEDGSSPTDYQIIEDRVTPAKYILSWRSTDELRDDAVLTIICADMG